MSIPSPAHPGAPDWVLPFLGPPPAWSAASSQHPDARIAVLRPLHRHRWEILAHYPRTALYPSSWGTTQPPGEVGPLVLLWVLSPWFGGACPECRGPVVGLAAGGRGRQGSVRGRCLECGVEVWRQSQHLMHLYCQRFLKGFEFAVNGWVPFCHAVPWTPHPDVVRLTERLDARSPALTDLLGRLDEGQPEGAQAVRQAELASPELNALLLRVPEHRGGSTHA